ncbi:chorismate--pyruvate lyase family protein [Pseudomonas sp. Marseille-QA0892]
MPDLPPRWEAEAALLHVEPQIRSWLFDQDSLTQRLTNLASGAFDVLPLQEGWQVLRDGECHALNLPSGSLGWCREVLLRGHEEPWVFARSVAGETALQQEPVALATLGNRSLGQLLFSDSAFTRGPLTATCCPPQWLPNGLQASLWARRSTFQRNGLGILVMEVFLPALWRYTNTAHAIE